MIALLRKWFGQRSADARAIEPARVEFDDVQVVRHIGDGRRETVRWDELDCVWILTTDEGPFVDDVYFMLAAANGGCAIASDLPGMKALLPRLQALPGFDNAVVVQAMGSTANAKFVCWRRASPVQGQNERCTE